MKYEIYCDESCWEALFDKDAHQYAVIGGIWIPAECRQQIKADIKSLKESYGLMGEMKWNKVCPSTISMYEDVINMFFNNDNIRFRAICIKTDEINNEKYNNGNGELGFYKFYFQLLHHWITWDNSYSIFLDYKINGNQHRVKELGRILKKTSSSDILNIQALPSNESLLIQLADVLTGATAYAYNSNDINKSSKQRIKELIEQRLNHRIQGTGVNETKFNIFNINLRKGW